MSIAEMPIGAARAPVDGREPIDIEELLRWAIGQTGYLPWCNPSDDDLALDHGWDCVPKGTRALYQPSRGIALRRGIDPDAAFVVEAVKALDGEVAAQIIACARQGIRPNCLEGVEPRRVAKHVYAKKRGKKKHRRSIIMVWEPCDPETICLARAAYVRWHRAVASMIAALRGQLMHWRITGFSAPPVPWEQALEKID